MTRVWFILSSKANKRNGFSYISISNPKVVYYYINNNCKTKVSVVILKSAPNIPGNLTNLKRSYNIISKYYVS